VSGRAWETDEVSTVHDLPGFGCLAAGGLSVIVLVLGELASSRALTDALLGTLGFAYLVFRVLTIADLESSTPRGEGAGQHRAAPQSAATRSRATPRPRPKIRVSSARLARTCPLCRAALGEALPRRSCASCATLHHAACWDELGGCAVLGCRDPATLTRARREVA
jgi:hypothetical protein